jgi:fibronectin type 3 domain-containing protein
MKKAAGFLLVLSAMVMAGCESEVSQSNPAYTVKAPTGVTAVYASKVVTISWIDDPDVYEYGVFRSASADGEYTLVDTTYVTNEGTDSNVIAGNTYYYKVKAALVNGTKSDFSESAAVKITCPSFAVSSEVFSLDTLSYLHVKGTLKNTGDGTAYFVKITYYMYKNDVIVDTADDYPLDSNDFVPGASAAFDVTFYDLKSLTAYDRYEAKFTFYER